MKEIPILFSTPMVMALLEGRKNQTRRLNGLENIPSEGIDYARCENGEDQTFLPRLKPGLYAFLGNSRDDTWYTPIKCPYGRPGDVLWVRETWSPDLAGDGEDGFKEYIRYAADGVRLPIEWVKDYDRFKNRPGIHMNKEYARIWLQVESVRVERLQDISEEDAIAEGVKPAHCETNQGCPSLNCKDQCSEIGNWWNYRAPNGEGFPAFSARSSFESLWESINGADSWQANPFCWVISFTVLSTTGKPDLQTT